MHDSALPLRVPRARRRGLVRPFVTLALLCSALASLAPSAAGAAPLAGRLGSPSDFVPALTVHAWSKAERRLYSVGTSAGQSSYVLEVPPGRYLVFATPADPDAPPVYGAHTRFSVCARDATALQSGACRDHSLVEVEVAQRRVDGVDVTDWYLDDAAVAELDAMLGRSADAVEEAQLAAPRFSEYPAVRLAAVPRATALQPDPDPRVERDRAALVAALAAPPTFAGRYAIVRVPCSEAAAVATSSAGAEATSATTTAASTAAAPSAPGTGAAAGIACESAAILDLPLGRAAYPRALDPLPAADPCADRGALQFRRDSRLLTHTAREGNQLVTRYFLWDGEAARLRSLATLASDLPERCAEPRAAAGAGR